MKQILLFILVLLLSFFSLSAQVTQEQADEIIIERMGNDTSCYIIYAKDSVQLGFEIITSTGETLELDYSCWVYYVNFIDKTKGKYLIVKESNGNLLEINTKNDEDPIDLTYWRIVLFLKEFSLSDYSCQLVNLNNPSEDGEIIIINSAEELKNYITCSDNIYPDIDFTIQTLILAFGKTNHEILGINIENFLQLSCKEYKLDLQIIVYDITDTKVWNKAIITNKIGKNSHIEVKVTYEVHYTTIAPNRTWRIEHGYACPEMDTCHCYQGLETISIGNIQSFNGKEYYELITDAPNWENGIITYVREENGKVFFYTKECNKEYLLYDFGLKVDDVISLVDVRFPFSIYNPGSCELTEEDINACRYKVAAVDSIEYDGIQRKRLKIVWYYNTDLFDYWVEGIGNMRGITWGAVYMTGAHQVKDFYEGNELLFINENPQYCWISKGKTK